MDENVTITTTYIYISKNHHLIMTKVEIRIGKPQVLIFIGSAKLEKYYSAPSTDKCKCSDGGDEKSDDRNIRVISTDFNFKH